MLSNEYFFNSKKKKKNDGSEYCFIGDDSKSMETRFTIISKEISVHVPKVATRTRLEQTVHHWPVSHWPLAYMYICTWPNSRHSILTFMLCGGFGCYFGNVRLANSAMRRHFHSLTTFLFTTRTRISNGTCPGAHAHMQTQFYLRTSGIFS